MTVQVRHGMHNANQLELRSAVGYPDYSYLTTPLNVSKTLAEFRDMNPLESITNTDYKGKIGRKGQIVRFRHKVRGRVHRYHTDMPLKTDTMSFRFVEICMARGLYANLKVEITDKDIEAVRQGIAEWRESTAEDARNTMLREALAHMIFEVPAYHQGNVAGIRSGTRVNLGSDAAPLLPDPSNVTNIFSLANAIAETAKWPAKGRWIIGDTLLMQLLLRADKFNNDQCCNVGSQSMLSGKLPITNFSGFDLHITDQLISTPDGNRVVLFGHKMATTYGSDVAISRTVTTHMDFSERNQWLWLYGFGVIYRDMLGMIIWSPANVGTNGILGL